MLLLLLSCAADPAPFWQEDYPSLVCGRKADCSQGELDMAECLADFRAGGEQMLELDCAFTERQAQACLDSIAVADCSGDVSVTSECTVIVQSCD